MATLPIIHLKPGKERSILRFHPWVFSGAIARSEGEPQDGDVVRVKDRRGEVIGVGHYRKDCRRRSCAIFGDILIDDDFWNKAFSRCFAHRRRIGFPSSATNIFRFVRCRRR